MVIRKPKSHYKVEDSGEIVDQRGGLLYDSDSLEGLSIEARKRLAELHGLYPALEWEGYGHTKGGLQLLVEEGLADD